MPKIGVPELIIILVIVVAIFGAGKLANLGGALGKGVADFKKQVGSSGSDDDSETGSSSASKAETSPVETKKAEDAEAKSEDAD